jgi:hypothetical protein
VAITLYFPGIPVPFPEPKQFNGIIKTLILSIFG